MGLFSGQAFQCKKLPGDIVELTFDLKDDSVNKLNRVALSELKQAVASIQAEAGVKALLITSAKDVFIVGADITEFLGYFKAPEQELLSWIGEVNKTFSAIEDLPFPSAVAINGFALGGGFELSLAATYRVASTAAKVGLPETKLGIYPGWGGTVRLSRVAGADTAIEWIAGGEQLKPEEGLKVGALDAVVAPEHLRDATLAILSEAIAGLRDWKARVAEKKSPLKLPQTEQMMAFETAKAFVFSKAGPNYPAPIAAIEAMQKGATMGRDEALAIEMAGFAKIAKTPAAESLVSIFLGDQYLKKISKKAAKDAQPVATAAVLGAGIMGGGVAYQSASRGIPIYMKDIAPKAIDLGLSEAGKLFSKQVERGKLTPPKMAESMGRIRPTLSYGDFKNVDFVVEAVVENEKVKKSVLAEVEAASKENTIIASNTSTISITALAESLKRPENFCGMHFFNPVHRMPLVEIIRGKKTSEKTIATTVAYALAMGKTPIVVNDCAGFFINRVLFPYLAGFSKILAEGVDFQRVDKAMEKFGWPMGPAYLLDVVGIDTAFHCDNVMAGAFPDRMKHDGMTAIEAMYKAQRFGQKNGKGFYTYVPDKKGPPKKTIDPGAYEIVKPVQKGGNVEMSDEEIVDRMMLPMILECSRCLEDGIVATPVEADLGLVYGVGFPPFRGGAFKYADRVGAAELLKKAEKYSRLGKLYEPTAQLKALAASGKTFYPNT